MAAEPTQKEQLQIHNSSSSWKRLRDREPLKKALEQCEECPCSYNYSQGSEHGVITIAGHCNGAVQDHRGISLVMTLLTLKIFSTGSATSLFPAPLSFPRWLPCSYDKEITLKNQSVPNLEVPYTQLCNEKVSQMWHKTNSRAKEPGVSSQPPVFNPFWLQLPVVREKARYVQISVKE